MHFFDFADEFDKEVEIEIMRSERLRARLLSVVFAFIGVVFLLFRYLLPTQIDQIFHSRLNDTRLVLFPWGVSLYEFLFSKVIDGFIQRQRRFPLPPRLGNAFIETSIPSFLILFLASVFHPAYALHTPVVLLYFIFIILSTLRLDPRVSFFTGLVAAIEYLILAWYLLGKGDPAGVDPFFLMKAPHFSKAFILFAGGAITAFVAHRIRGGLVSYLKSRDEKEKISNIFGQHVSPRVVEKLIQQKEGILSETRHVCVMFLDIRNFTAFSQNRHPEEVVAYLNVLFDFMIEIVNRHNGIINKFLGDGFMAVFGAPFSDGLDSVHAVRAGIEIIEKVDEYVQTGKIVPTRVGIGLHTGEVVTGNIGSILRKEYTVIGDVVNVASRIESLNKQFGTQFLISEEVKRAIEKHAGEISGKVEGVANMEALGCVAVKGREAQVEIYKVR